MNFHNIGPAAPKSTPPRLEELSQSVRARRGRRRVLQASSIFCIAGLLLVAALVRREDDVSTLESRDSVRDVGHHSSLAAIESPIEEIESRMQVLARVIQPEPIFHVDPETQLAWQVGWIETELSVPMDIKQFSPDQRARFQNVLFQKDNVPSL
jgi:hypothetical protein